MHPLEKDHECRCYIHVVLLNPSREWCCAVVEPSTVEKVALPPGLSVLVTLFDYIHERLKCLDFETL